MNHQINFQAKNGGKRAPLDLSFRLCNCGSNQPPEALRDARGIFIANVCKYCRSKVMNRYRPEIFINPDYESDEDIDPS